MECLFCKIAGKEISAYVVAEDEHAVAFLDIHPRVPGHTMVISKTHSATLLDLPEEEIGPLFRSVQKIARRLTSALHADGLSIGINNGSVTGQEVGHLHVHLMPRFAGDGGKAVQSLAANEPKETLEEIQKKIREVPA